MPSIYVAGAFLEAKRVCHDYCALHGLRAEVQAAPYRHGGCNDDGVQVELMGSWDDAVALSDVLKQHLHQSSALVVHGDRALWSEG